MNVSRRKLLLAGGGILATACGPQANVPLPVTIAAGNAKDLAQGTLHAIDGMSVAIGRDAAGIYAMSLICTHQGCDMSTSPSVVSAGRVECYCHHSRFDAQGNVVQGPATAPLPHLIVTEDAAGSLTIHGDEPTAATTRLPST